MKTIHQWFDEYAVSHQNKTNKLIHWFCVPMIFFSIICMLADIPSGVLKSLAPEGARDYIHWGTVLIAGGLLFYLRLSFPLFLGMLLESLFILFLIKELEAFDVLPLWLLGLSIFVIAWIGQFYGHKVEGKKPSFFKDLQFLLIGPAWVLSFLFDKMGVRY
ncbi:DUF962 domain-containing protein [Xanthovirga aplysinae]|uniref:Mpo1 family 2-hydroxy fatty acid dioxygenase n=1 Tax=Xanthovirga aplysinae TaxID=2529853 RepID=UPI0012BD51CB|nr:Mpo1-like protein [Xanthovirga aplysinae]MTI29273.1 DUF962 domain-containing protein [Xanthovirga aplysinae]